MFAFDSLNGRVDNYIILKTVGLVHCAIRTVERNAHASQLPRQVAQRRRRGDGRTKCDVEQGIKERRKQRPVIVTAANGSALLPAGGRTSEGANIMYGIWILEVVQLQP